MSLPLKKLLLPGIIGNTLEWFEFSLYGYFASILSQLFFPSQSHWLSLAQTFAVFAAGFLMRPIGAIFFGHLGDRFGRQKILALSILMMAVPTTCLGLLPTNATIGIFAGLFLLLFRLIQGFAIGGELGGSLVYMIEHAPGNKRGLYSSLSKLGLYAGVFLGSSVAAMTGHALSPSALSDWGWRVPFLFGIPLGALGIYLRHKLPETPFFLDALQKNLVILRPLYQAFFGQKIKMLTVFFLTMPGSIGFYLLFVFFPSYLKNISTLTFSQVMIINSLSMLINILLMPLAGVFSDRYGRKPLLFASAIGFFLFSYPLFFIINHYTSLNVIFFAQTCFSILLVPFSAIPNAVFIEIFPTELRYSASCFPLNLATAIFGGTTPLVASYLIHTSGNPNSPAWYLMLSSALTLLFLFKIPESHQNSLG